MSELVVVLPLANSVCHLDKHSRMAVYLPKGFMYVHGIYLHFERLLPHHDFRLCLRSIVAIGPLGLEDSGSHEPMNILCLYMHNFRWVKDNHSSWWLGARISTVAFRLK